MNIISIKAHIRFPRKAYKKKGFLITYTRNPMPDFIEDIADWYSIPHNKAMYDEWDKVNCSPLAKSAINKFTSSEILCV